MADVVYSLMLLLFISQAFYLFVFCLFHMTGVSHIIIIIIIIIIFWCSFFQHQKFLNFVCYALGILLGLLSNMTSFINLSRVIHCPVMEFWSISILIWFIRLLARFAASSYIVINRSCSFVLREFCLNICRKISSLVCLLFCLTHIFHFCFSRNCVYLFAMFLVLFPSFVSPLQHHFLVTCY